MARLFAVSFVWGRCTRPKRFPYVFKYGIEVTPYSSLDKVRTDCQGPDHRGRVSAEDESLVTAARTNAADGLSCRITHFNLYAVCRRWSAPTGRWGKSGTRRGGLCRAVIDSGKFPLMTMPKRLNVEAGTLNMQETIW